MEINKNIKNSNDAIRNTQFMSLSPTIVEKLDKVYVDALDFVIENEKIKVLNELLEKEIENIIFNDSNEASNSNWYKSVPMSSKEIKIKFIFSMRDDRNHLPECDVDLISLYTKLGVIRNEDVEIKTGNKNTTVENYKKQKK